MSSRRENIKNASSDAGMDFIYYDRKEYERLPRGEIEAAVKAGEVTYAEIAGWFIQGMKG